MAQMNSQIYGQLIVFHAIVTHGSISAAARYLNIGAPAVSKSLRLLEDHIGLPLFRRTTRRVELTEAGQLLLSNTTSEMHSLEYALEMVQDLGNTPMGHVRMTTSGFAYECILKPHLADFCAEYPQIQLEISINDGLVDILAEGFDLGLRFGDRIEEGMVARQILPPIKEGLFVSAAYIERYGEPKLLADLINHRLIGYRFIASHRILPLILNQNGQEITIDMPTSMMTDSADIIADATRQGLGIGRIFEPRYNQFADKEKFIPILKNYWRGYPAVYVYFLQNSQKARRIRVFIDFLIKKNKVIL